LWPRPAPFLAAHIKGVRFNMIETKTIYICFIVSLVPGQGHVSRYLDDLPRDWTVIFHDVSNPILREALLRRGFHQCMAHAVEWNEIVSDCYVREAKEEAG